MRNGGHVKEPKTITTGPRLTRSASAVLVPSAATSVKSGARVFGSGNAGAEVLVDAEPAGVGTLEGSIDGRRHATAKSSKPGSLGRCMAA